MITERAKGCARFFLSLSLSSILTMEENRAQLRRSAIGFILSIYVFFLLLAIAAFFLITELEKDNIVTNTQLERGVVTVIFLFVWTLVCYRLYRINMRVFDLRSQVFDAREAEFYATKEAARLREQFMANMSHEIRTPLNAIIGMTGLLQRGQLKTREQELASNIQVASENLLNIVNDILDFSKLEAGMLTLEKVPFDLNGLFHSVKQLLSEKARQKNLSLDMHLAPGLPHQLIGDPTRLTQILINLISNAIKFTQNGGVVISVVPVGAENKSQTTIRIEVRDSGIGIPAQELDRVFERFTQSDEKTTRVYGGTGLGLSIVKQLVDVMQGSISLQSQAGKGSVFTVLLPFDNEIAQATAPEKPSELPEKNSATVEVNFAHIHVLVAEDNPLNRRVVELLFEEWKCPHTMAQNGREALDLLSNNPNAFDLVLMDIQMPEMDGYEATRQIRHNLGLQIPIIAMTAHALAGEREKCLQLGMSDYLSKPIREQELRQVIARFSLKTGIAMPPTIDLAYLQETTMGNAAYQQELAKIFLAQVPKDMEAIAAALSIADLSTASKAAHNMKSTVGYMGFARNIGQQLTAFEVACNVGDTVENLTKALQTIRVVVAEAQALVIQSFDIAAPEAH